MYIFKKIYRNISTESMNMKNFIILDTINLLLKSTRYVEIVNTLKLNISLKL